MKLLEQLINVASPSGSEYHMKAFVLEYVRKNSAKWKTSPKILEGDHLQDNIILIFGEPRTAIFAHMDSIGFTVRYQDQLVAIGGPDVENGYVLVGQDSKGPVECTLRVDDDGHLFYDFARGIETGTTLTWKPSLIVTEEFIEGTYMDNRLGMYAALKVAETLENGAIVFSSFEEHGGGAVPMLVKYLAEHYPSLRQALISDITWVTEGVAHGGGVAISMRDKNIPRRKFLEKIIALADQSGIDYQLEVEGSGSSDGREVHHSPYPIDWLFIGAPEDNVHTPHERVHVYDLEQMIRMYEYLMKAL